MPFTTANELREFKRIIRKILLDALPEVLTLHDVLGRFKSYTKSDFKRWFKENHRDIPKSIPLFETHLNDVVILDMKSRAPDILVIGKGDAFKAGNVGDRMQRMSRDSCENNLKRSIQAIQTGSSKDTAIEVQEEEEAEEDFFEFDYVDPNIPFTDEFNELLNDVSKFNNYRDFQMVHIAYTKLRMVFMYNHIGRSSIHIHTLMALFRQLFNESFFQNTILKHYITSSDDRTKNVVTFLQRFCGDFLFVNAEGKAMVSRSLSTISTKLMQNLVKSIAKISGLGGPGLSIPPPSNPPHINFTGNPANDPQAIDVRRCPEYTSFSAGLNKPMVSNFLDFPGINKGPEDKGHVNRPSIHDVNDAINTIRARMCREHEAVKVPEIIKELCKMYGVASLRDLRPSQHREIRRESDIPALNDIIKLQGKVNAFSQAFGTFRNVTTLHELEEELCRMESKQCFDDLRLGPLQKQLIVWDIFQFPPDKDGIPPITTFDVFRLLWKCYDEKYNQERINAKSEGTFTTAREMHVKILLPDFLEYVRQSYGFSLAEESGVRINNVGHALQACRKAWFSDSHNVSKSMKKFKEQLTAEFMQQLEHTKNMLLGPLLNPEEEDNENLREKFKEIPLMDSLRTVYDILQHLKREACKTLPTTAYLVNFSDITMNALAVIQKDELMSKIFNFIFTIAPFKVVGKTDIQILKYLGFQKAVDQMMSGVPDETKTAVNIEAATNMDPNAVAVSAATSASDKVSKVFPKSIVTSTVNKWFSKATTLDLKVLATIESQITSEIHEAVSSFDRLGHGSFLKFITENKSLFRMLEFGTATSAEVLGAKVTKEELKHFVIQCGQGKKKSDISRAIEMQYKIQIQGKNADQILKVADENRKRRECLISYQHTYLVGTDYHRDCKDNGNRKSFTQLALKRIKAAPFLVDLGEWINWDIMFSAKLGSLKEFLNMNFTIRESTFTFMELNIGRYVKVLKFCSLDDFRKALDTLDASKTSACLVNILMSSLTLNNAPISMVSNLIQNSFMQHIGREFHPNSSAGKDLIVFVLECFRFIPFEMLCCVAQKLFINRLAAAFGNQKVNDMILEMSSQQSDQTYRQILHGLGYQLSITEWIKDAEQFIAVYESPSFKKVDELNEKKEEVVEEVISKEKPVPAPNYEEISDDEDEPVLDQKPVDAKEDVEMKGETPAKEEIMKDESNTVTEGEENVKGEVLDEKPITEETPDETKVKVEEIKPLTCQEFIEKIRRDEFGVGIKFGEEEKKILDIHRAREGRSLDRLSRELYTKDSHFVLELIQNADDNEYSEEFFDVGSAEKPTVCFIVEPQCVTVLNNEKGFTNANVKALCDIGKSTKGIHRKGYIGQKGIGFKSVFRVTDKPEVHSNGFHIRYDASYGPNGYILPQWADERQEIEYTLPNSTNDSNLNWATKIVLPLKTEMQHAKLTSRFHDIHPSLLMFLNRLHTIIIDDKVSGTVKVMKKEMIDKNLVKLTENDQSTLWFVVTKEIPIELKEEIKQTDISIAFPLPDPNKDLNETLPAQPIFAYLPLRSYGFKFIIQADFEVPSSREDIDMDSAWNQCILHYIPELVAEAFTQFKAHPHFTGYQGIIEYFKFMDLEDHVLGIFKQVAHNVIKGLQRKPCIPYVFTQPEGQETNGKAQEKMEETPAIEGSSTDVEASEAMANETQQNQAQIMWTLPTSCVVGTEDLRKTVPPNMLLKNLGLNFVAKELQNNVKESILESLGVSKMSVEQLVDIAKAFLNDVRERAESGEKISVGERQKNFDWIGEWLSVIFTTMQENCDYSQETLSLIKSLKIFVLCDGSFVSMNEQTIFFPIDLDVTTNKKNNQSEPLRVIEKDLQILTYDIYLNLDLIQKQQVRRLLKDLGVKSMTPSDLIYNHIIPLFKEKNWKSKSEDLLIACVSYLRQQMTVGLFTQISELKEHIVLATNKGLKSPSADRIYIPSEYGNEHRLKEKFPACDWTLVSPKYLSENTTTLQKKSWLEFFQTIGLDVFVKLQPKTVEMHSSDLAHSVWKDVYTTWPATENGTYTIEDLTLPEFNKLIASKQRNEIVGFSYLINNYWEERFQKHDLQKANCVVKDTNGTVLTNTNSSFFLMMQESKWIPSTTEQLHIPSDLYIVNPSVERLFANKVSYIHPKISNDDFRETLGVQREVKMTNFITQFKRWNGSTNVFTTTYGHVQNIYRYVRDVLVEEAKDIMVDKCIFLPSQDVIAKKFKDDDKVEGNFYKIKEVCWDDPSGIVEISKDVYGTRRILKGFFADQMRDFFVQMLGVPMFPTTSEYLNAAYNLVNRTILPDKDALRKLFKMFCVLGQKCCISEKVEELKEWGLPDSTKERIELYHSLEDFVDPDMRKTLQSDRNMKTRLIPTSSNVFLAMENRPILSIDPEVHSVYAKDRQVDVAVLSDIARTNINHKEDKLPSHLRRSKELEIENITLYVMLFYKTCGLELLYDLQLKPEIVAMVVTGGCYFWELVLHNIVPAVQRYMMVYLPDIYDDLQKQNFAQFLLDTEINMCAKLEVLHHLKNRTLDIHQDKIAVVQFVEDENKAIVYVNKTFGEGFQQGEVVLREMMSIFAGIDKKAIEMLSDFILTYTTVLNKEAYMRRKRLLPIPEGEKVWEFKKPEDPFPTDIEDVPSKGSGDKKKKDGNRKKIDRGDVLMKDKQPKDKDGEKVDLFEGVADGLYDDGEEIEEFGTGTDGKKDRSGEPKSKRARRDSGVDEEDPEEEEGGRKKRRRVLPRQTKEGGEKSSQAEEGEEEEKDTEREGEIETEEVVMGVDVPPPPPPDLPSKDAPPPPEGEEAVDFEVKGREEDERPTDPRLRKRKLDDSDGEIEDGEVKEGNSWFNDFNAAMRYNALKPTKKFLKNIVDLKEQYEDVPMDSKEGKAGGEKGIDLDRLMVEKDPGHEVGMMGEEIVYKHLCHLYADELKKETVNIEWLNEDEEFGLPYDMKLTFFDERQPPVLYIEVKTTFRDEKKEFEISSNQIRFAFEQGERFQLYRLTGIRSPKEMKLRRLANLATYLNNKSVKLFMVL